MHLVHHVECEHYRSLQCHKLQRQVQVALYVRRVNDVYYTVGLLFQNERARDNFFRRVGRKRIYAGKIRYKSVRAAFYRATFLVDRNAGKVTDMLVRSRKLIKKRRLSAVLVSGKCESERFVFWKRVLRFFFMVLSAFTKTGVLFVVIRRFRFLHRCFLIGAALDIRSCI